MTQIDFFNSDERQDSTPPAVPYRTDPRPAPPGSWDNLNQQHGHTGARAFEAPQAAIRRIREAKSASPSRLKSWAYHPDERVLIALLDSGLINPGRAGWKYEAKQVMTLRALEDIDAGQLWTPLADALAHTNAWEDSRHSQAADLGYGHVENPWRRKDVAAKRLTHDWIPEQTDADALRPLLAFKYRSLLIELAKKAQVLDDDLLRRLSEREGYFAVVAYENPALSEEQRDAMLRSSFERLLSAPADPGRPRARGARLIVEHVRSGQTLPRSRIRQLLALLDECEGEAEWGTPAGEASRILMLDPVLDTLASAELVRLIEVGGLGSWSLEKIGKAAGADEDVWEAALKASPSARLRARLAATNKVAHSSKVAEILARSSQPEVARAALRGADPQAFAKAFRTVSASDPEYALRALEARGDDIQNVLRKEDFQSLLEHGDSQIRLRAIKHIRALKSGQRR